eukprot:1772274-Pyramimonas_sp.AAC.1
MRAELQGLKKQQRATQEDGDDEKPVGLDKLVQIRVGRPVHRVPAGAGALHAGQGRQAKHEAAL